MSVYLQLAIILSLSVVNGLLAMSEFALVSSRDSRLQTLAAGGRQDAIIALDLARDPGRFLSTLQLGMTLVGVLSGAFSGATFGINLSRVLVTAGLPEAFAHFIGVGFVVTMTTYVTVIIGELVPKRIALLDPESVACIIAPTVELVAGRARPVVEFLEKSSDLIMRSLGLMNAQRAPITDEEIRRLAEQAEEIGNIKPGESRLISRVLDMGNHDAASIMTKRDSVECIDLSLSLESAIGQIRQSPFRCFPAFEGKRDNIQGIIWVKDLVGPACSDSGDLKNFLREAPRISSNADLLITTETLKHAKMHMGLVYDHQDHFVGVVTAGDILDTIVGSFERVPRA
jgi:putative hemolysin